MALAKTVTFIVYVILVLVAINFPLTLWSQFSMGTLLAIALLHLFECYYYRALCEETPGSTGTHLAKVFVFGLFHMLEMRAIMREIILERARKGG